VALGKKSSVLSESVVIGYGSSSKAKLTTSVATVKKEQINDLPITNLSDAFTGNVSGVAVEDGSGGPGDAPVIRVRGYGSINAGSEPLYVIDGMIATANEFALLNPKSVQSISILKDAAAGAIYGSRAGNGVVIVTTKGGEGKAKFSYNTTVGLQKVERKIDVLSGPEYIEYSKRAYAASGLPAPVFSPDVANTNWQDEIFRTGLYQNHQISANGGVNLR
jgi:TonB-dependent SusC/RagA subfamily outer membrane receptor